MEYDFRQSSRPPPSPSTTGQPPSPYPTPPPPTCGIRVAIKPDYTIKPPPPLLRHEGDNDIPRSNFLFNFQFERNVLAEAVNQNPNWNRLLGVGPIGNIPPPRTTEWNPSCGPTADHIVNKYIATGLNTEAVTLAVAKYGDNPIKVKEFASGFILLREMGFSPVNVAEALFMYDNDTAKALVHFLNNTS